MALLNSKCANVNIKIKMANRKPIKLKKGCKKKLAGILKVSEVTVYNAVHWKCDSDVQNLVRQKAKELGFIKQF